MITDSAKPSASGRSLVYCGLAMFGIVFAFRHLNRMTVDAGASYAWVGRVFSPALGFFAGWALLISSVVFMVSGTLPAAEASLKLLAPVLVGRQGAVTSVAALWLVGIGAVVAKGIKISSYLCSGRSSASASASPWLYTACRLSTSRQTSSASAASRPGSFPISGSAAGRHPAAYRRRSSRSRAAAP